MLIEVIEHVKAAGGRPQTLWGRRYGQEKVLATSAIARMNLLLKTVSRTSRSCGTTRYAHRRSLTARGWARFDCVIAKPPFSLTKWGEDAWESDRWGYNELGGVPKGYADWAWVQHLGISGRTGGLG